MPEELGLRERKKQQTRREISDVATRMFIERGFDEVTVAEIAAAANVSKMTVFNYFPRKEDLFWDRSAELEPALRAALAGRAPGESVLGAIRRLLLEAMAEHNPVTGVHDGIGQFWGAVERSPALRARSRELNEELEQGLGRYLAEETGAEPGDSMPWIVAGILAGAYRNLVNAALRRVMAGESADQIYPDQVALLSRVFDLLEHGGLGDYAVKPA